MQLIFLSSISTINLMLDGVKENNKTKSEEQGKYKYLIQF
jgi:hypothetical protein